MSHPTNSPLMKCKSLDRCLSKYSRIMGLRCIGRQPLFSINVPENSPGVIDYCKNKISTFNLLLIENDNTHLIYTYLTLE